MADSISKSETELPHPPFPLGPGQILRQAREACRLTQEEIAKQLRLGVQRIREIENNDFSKMQAVIYAQGYLRAYADIVKAPIESVLESFKAIEWVQQEKHPTRQVKVEKWVRTALPIAAVRNSSPSNSSSHWLSYTLIALAVVVAVGVIWDYWPSEDNQQVSDFSVPVPAAVPASVPLATNPADISLAVAPVANQAKNTVENPFIKPLNRPKAAAPIVEAQPATKIKADQ